MLQLIRNEYYTDPQVPVWMSFGTRASGNARHASEIQSFLKRQNITSEHLIIPQQTHSDTICEVTAENITTPFSATDGLITAVPQVVLSVRTADCVPVIYIDYQAQLIGISHQGWKGTLQNMMKKMLVAMQSRGARNISVFIGPCISVNAYGILQERVDAFASAFPQFRSSILKVFNHQWHLDLGLLNQLQAEEAGATSVERLPVCTYSQPDLFYSFRGEGTALSGQLLHTVMLRS